MGKAAKDLRSFIKYLEKKAPQEFTHVKREVNPNLELPGVLRKLQAEGKYPAVLFENVKGSKMPVIVNLFANRKKIACALETSEDKLLEEYGKRIRNPIPSKLVRNGPVKEVINIGDKVDLTKLPVVTHNGKDAGPFIDAGILITRQPETGVMNSGLFRMQVTGKKKTGLFLGKQSHTRHIHEEAQKRGEDLEAVLCLGHHPAVTFGSQALLEYGTDELAITGGLLDEPLEVVKCETVDLVVPADTEIAIEGRIPTKAREPEGPFGEYTGYFGPERISPIFEVTAITHREDAIYHDVFAAHPEHVNSSQLSYEYSLYLRLKKHIPQVMAVRLPTQGVHHLVYVQIRKEFDGLGVNTGLAILGLMGISKIAVIVDEDVDINRDEEVLWAIVTRTRPEISFHPIPMAFTGDLDPAAHKIGSWVEKDGLNSKLIIDATKPIEAHFEETADVPREIWQKINLKDYIAKT